MGLLEKIVGNIFEKDCIRIVDIYCRLYLFSSLPFHHLSFIWQILRINFFGSFISSITFLSFIMWQVVSKQTRESFSFRLQNLFNLCVSVIEPIFVLPQTSLFMLQTYKKLARCFHSLVQAMLNLLTRLLISQTGDIELPGNECIWETQSWFNNKMARGAE